MRIKERIGESLRLMSEEELVLHKMFGRVAREFPQRVALQAKKDDRWQTVTYAELEDSSLKVADFLIRQGLKKGSSAALILENRPEWVVIYLGLMYAGLICVPLDPELSAEELGNLIADSQAALIFSSLEIFERKIKPGLPGGIKSVILDAPETQPREFISFQELQGLQPDKNNLPAVSCDDTASLIYTSGTTGEPKGVLLTHKNICSNFLSIRKLNICVPSDNLLAVLPLYHAYAFMVTLVTPLLLGAKTTYFNLKLKPQELASLIKEAGVTIFAGVPQIFIMLHRAIFDKIRKVPSIFVPVIFPFMKARLRNQFGRSLRLLVSGGARLEPKIGRDLSRLGLKLIEGFGLTETSPIVTINPPQRIKFGSVGKPLPDVEIKIFKPGASGIGEVLIRGPNVMKGYYKQPELTAHALKDGWFYSGDSGFLDREGYLFLTGRTKEVIVLSSGKNIYPEELEEYYGRSLFIKEICVLSKIEERFGRPMESLYAVVVPDLDHFGQARVSDIRSKIRWELENLAEGLSPYKHIMGFTVTKEELPRTALRKIKRYQVKEKYLDGKVCDGERDDAVSKEDAVTLQKDASRKIIDYICRESGRRAGLDSHLELDLGIDSLSRVELQIGLESLLAIKIPDEAFSKISTVRELITAVSDIEEGSRREKDEGRITEKNWAEILKQLPREEIKSKIEIENSVLEKLVNWIFKSMFLFLFRLFWFLRVEGRDNLPAQGPYIICPNHASYLDGLVVSSSLKFRQSINTFFLGYSGIFRHPLVSWSVKLARLIPVDPERNLVEAMQTVAFVLSYKKTACVFAEGRRSIDEKVGEFKKGVGILIKELDVPAVPVYIRGSHRSWPRTSRLPRLYPLKVIFGKPLSARELISKAGAGITGGDYEAIVKGLREEVIKLS